MYHYKSNCTQFARILKNRRKQERLFEKGNTLGLKIKEYEPEKK